MKNHHIPFLRRLAAVAVLCCLGLNILPGVSAATALRQISMKNSVGLELEVTEIDLEITANDPHPKAYLYTGGQSSDYFFIVWMSSNPAVATVDGDGRVTGRSAGTATITAISDRGDRASCKVVVTKQSEEEAAKAPALSASELLLTIQYNQLHPTSQLTLENTNHSYLYVYQWLSSDPAIASVSSDGLVTALKAGTATITALVSNGQALRCAVTVKSDIGRVSLNKNELLLRTIGEQETLTATVAVDKPTSVPITWVSSNSGVATVDANGLVTAIADGETTITALTPEGRFDTCTVCVGIVAEKYASEEDAADELELPSPYVAVRLNRLNLRS